eukprot:CAMPEP_0182617920 /NCGR_PEP_ID=MMETSP1330-20130603/43836_1 /TAXON_ID=464278 /ORGANISM="Picochlorum sp., Strain RCC944" /LENGTH=224 /DNA_ID=CAMNT_0024838083 /DNA_START=39 /DNA_END=710 /DNA_ORIENTATION=-
MTAKGLQSTSTARRLAGTPGFTQARHHSRQRVVSTRAAAEISNKFSKVTPNGPRIVVKVAELQAKTLGGILLPDSSQKKPTSGDVIAVGKGKNYSLTLKEGDTVLYSKFGLGVVDIEMKGQEYAILFERDCMGIMPSSDATVDDIKDLSPLGDRLVIKVDSVEDETAGGVLLTEGATEKPTTGEVVAVGPGRLDEITGEVTKNKLKVGERVNFFKWAGDAIDTT